MDPLLPTLSLKTLSRASGGPGGALGTLCGISVVVSNTARCDVAVTLFFVRAHGLSRRNARSTTFLPGRAHALQMSMVECLPVQESGSNMGYRKPTGPGTLVDSRIL
jgi:hypothetical protein